MSVVNPANASSRGISGAGTGGAAVGGDPTTPKSVALSPHVTSTSWCTYCNVRLSYPAGAPIIHCPNCTNSFDPTAPQKTPCIGCRVMLQHAPNALYIQCPKCLQAFNPRLNRPPYPSLIIAPATNTATATNTNPTASANSGRLLGGSSNTAGSGSGSGSSSGGGSVVVGAAGAAGSGNQSKSADSKTESNSLFVLPATGTGTGTGTGGVASKSGAARGGASAAVAFPNTDSTSAVTSAVFSTLPASSAAAAGAAGGAGSAGSAVVSGGANSISLRRKRKKAAGEPKAAVNPYMVFCTRKRSEYAAAAEAAGENLSFGQIGSKLGSRWRAMTDTEKKPYDDEADLDKKRFEHEMQLFKAGNFVVCYTQHTTTPPHPLI